ncbi:MAG: transporter [Nocardioidaceae bacterium]|nr:transporter [Nocardioidaceae bacterium]
MVEHASIELMAALGKLRVEAEAAALTLETPGVEEARVTKAKLLDQLLDYILPRLIQLEAPMLAVVGGSTGAGKSTLVNSIVGERVTESGVLRPTTRSPVLVHHPDDAEWFQPDRILPELPRTSTTTNDTNALRLASSEGVPKGLAILDAPDVDSIDVGNRVLAGQLLAAADLWIFVTSAARYADQVPWDFLKSAVERDTSVAVVLDRTHADAIEEVRGHLARMMTSRGLSDSPLFTVAESGVDREGLLAREAVQPIIDWLEDLAADSDARSSIIFQTVDGAIRHNVFAAHDVADAMGVQHEAAQTLTDEVDRAYRQAADQVAISTADGSLLRGDVLARWQDFVGTGELLKSVEEKVSRIRDRLVDGFTGKRNRSVDVNEAVAQGLQMLILEKAEAAAETASRSWNAHAAGRALLKDAVGFERASREFRNHAERTVRDWQRDVLELVRVEGADKRMTARFLAFGVSGVGVALMIVVFSQTSTNAADEAVAPGGPATVGRRILDAIFGTEAVDRLAKKAHADLLAKVDTLLVAEKQRFLGLFNGPDDIAVLQESLRVAARSAERARHEDALDRKGLT